MLFTHNCRHQFFFSSFLCTWSLPTNPHFCLKAAPKAWGGDSLLLREERGDIQKRDRVPPSFLPAPPPDKESTSTLLPFPLVLPLRAQALSLFPSNGPSSLHWAEGWPGPPKRSCGMQVAKGWGFTLGQPAWLRTPPGKWPKTRRWSQGRAHLSSPAGEMCWAEACSRWRGGSCPLEPRSTFESAMMTWKRETGDSDLEKHPGLGEEGVGVQQRKQSCPWKKRGDRGAALLGHRKVQQACFPGCLKCSPSCKVCEITHWSLKECLIYSK